MARAYRSAASWIGHALAEIAGDFPNSAVIRLKIADGPVNQTLASPDFDGDFTAYVDCLGPRGFLAVGLRLTPVN